jgi:hypothetical protein
MAVNKDLLQGIFRPVNDDIIQNPNQKIDIRFPFKRGNLITFNYTFWKTDPYPLVIISKEDKSKGFIWGINLHRLLHNDIQKLVLFSKGSNFSYGKNIKTYTPFKEAYRSYKISGVRQVKTLNKDFLLNIINTIRSQDPAEIQIIRKNVQEQIRKQINPKAYEVNVKTLNKEEAQTQNQIGTVPIINTVPVVQNKTE